MRHDLDFERLHAFVTSQPLPWVHDQLIKLGTWPYERLPIQILSPVEAAERLKDRSLAALALSKAILAIVAHDGQLYVARTADVAWGIRKVHHVDLDDELQGAILDTYGRRLN